MADLYEEIFDAKPRCLWEDAYILSRLEGIKSRSHPQSILDIASGTGRLMTPFGTGYTAHDRDAEMLSANPADVVLHGDYEKLSVLPSCKFDLVTFIFGVFGNLSQFSLIVRETSRLLSPRGSFFFVLLSNGRLDSFIHETFYRWGDVCLVSKKKVESEFVGNGLVLRSLLGMTATSWDLFENSKFFGSFADVYMRLRIGDILPFYGLRWHYLVVEGSKP